MNESEYSQIIVESFYCDDGEARHGLVHIRPLPGQSPYEPTMFVECSMELKNDFDVGTKFQIRAKITSKEGGVPFIYSHYTWSYRVLQE